MTRACVLLLATALGTMEAHQRRVVEMGDTFALKVAEQVSIRGTTLLVGFERVLSDSRCPEGVQCVTAGDVSLSLVGQYLLARSARLVRYAVQQRVQNSRWNPHNGLRD
jgi:hypothetical protein